MALRAFIFLLLVSGVARAQLNDLIIVAYVDWNAGSGWALKVYNPTPQPIDLKNYFVQVFNGNNTTASNSIQLPGTLASDDYVIIDNALNAQYSTSFQACAADISVDALGVNEDDCLALTRGNTLNFVDMVGLYGQSAKMTVDGTANALYRQKLIRRAGNCTRYTATNGTAANSWPGNSNVNVTGWRVASPACLSRNTTVSLYPRARARQVELCPGDSVQIAGQWVRQAGTYLDTVASSQTCDSIIPTRVQFTSPPTRQEGYRLCPGDSILLGGSYYQSDTTVIYQKAASVGCDTLVSARIALDSVKADFQVAFDPVDSSRVQLSGTPGYALYRWYLEDSLLARGGANFTFEFNQGGPQTLSLVVENERGCQDTLQRVISVPKLEKDLSIPNVFSPNGDAYNPDFRVRNANDRSPFSIQIFNRYGRQVFEAKTADFRWDGTAQGQPVPTGTYFYRIQYGAESFRGHVALLR
ncbi:MAG: gliding motility-associated C-terminal domain-containing protein [Schleiferiaceae bacterium]|nr:gliding motility-associated C-terminal domain-containing protein [Schleiferiaceae bacterium]